MKKSRSFTKSIARMIATFAGSYVGGKAVGWLFDNIADRRSK